MLDVVRVRQIATHHPPSRFRRAVLHDRVAFESEELIEEHPLRVERLHDVGSCMEFDRTRPYGPDNRGNWFESRNAGSKPPPSSSSHSRNSCVSRGSTFLPSIANAFLRQIEKLRESVVPEMLALRVEIEPEELQRAFRLAVRYLEQTKGTRRCRRARTPIRA